MNHLSVRVPCNFWPIRHRGHAFYLLEGELLGQVGEAPVDESFVRRVPGRPLHYLTIAESELSESACALLQSDVLRGQVLEVYYENVRQSERDFTRVQGIACAQLGIAILKSTAAG